MTQTLDLDDFLDRNRITRTTWDKSGCTWSLMQAIAQDHEGQSDRLRSYAELLAHEIQSFPAVHSVRWRIKDADHLLEKIIRKCAEGQKKYKDLDSENYFEVVTDLVGLRALHLFKDDCFSIDSDLRRIWTPSESPTAYVREGDPPELTNKFRELGFEVKQHPAGYRSVHYVFFTQPFQRKVFAEIQVRTIFEEGWSEIDHRIRYPNFSDDQLVAYFLTIFNRLAGSADEMGTFVQGLTSALQAFDTKLFEANLQKEEALSAMERMLNDLNALKQQDADARMKLNSLQQEVAKLRKLPSLNDMLTDKHRSGIASLAALDSNRQLAAFGKGSTLSDALKVAAAPSGIDALAKWLSHSSSQNALARILPPKT